MSAIEGSQHDELRAEHLNKSIEVEPTCEAAERCSENEPMACCCCAPLTGALLPEPSAQRFAPAQVEIVSGNYPRKAVSVHVVSLQLALAGYGQSLATCTVVMIVQDS